MMVNVFCFEGDSGLLVKARRKPKLDRKRVGFEIVGGNSHHTSLQIRSGYISILNN